MASTDVPVDASAATFTGSAGISTEATQTTFTQAQAESLVNGPGRLHETVKGRASLSRGATIGVLVMIVVCGSFLGWSRLHCTPEAASTGSQPVMSTAAPRQPVSGLAETPEASRPNRAATIRGPEASETPQQTDAVQPRDTSLGFDRDQALGRLRAAAQRAGACRQKGSSPGTVRVLVKWTSSGQVASALVVGRPYAATPTARCVEAIFRETAVARFDGPDVALGASVNLQ